MIISQHNVMSSTIQKRKTYDVIITQDEDGGFVGKCRELHAFSQGDTFAEIMENMKEAIDLAIEDNPVDFNMLVMKQ